MLCITFFDYVQKRDMISSKGNFTTLKKNFANKTFVNDRNKTFETYEDYFYSWCLLFSVLEIAFFISKSCNLDFV